MSDDMYKSLLAFNATGAAWPHFMLKFRTLLEAKDLLYVIDRENDMPSASDSDAVLALKATQLAGRAINDAKVRGLFINKLNDDALSLVEDCTTAYEMIARLHGQFLSNSAASSLSRLDRLLDMKYDSTMDMSVHIGRVNSIITEIKSNGGLDLERLHAVIMLRSVKDAGPAFTSVVAALKAQEEESLTIDRIHRQLTETARDLKIQPVKKDVNLRSGVAFLGSADESEADTRVCYRCGARGHISPNCVNKPKPGWKPKAQYGSNRNVKAPNFDSRSGVSNPVSHFAFAGTSDRSMLDFSTVWIDDGGSVRHYTHDRRAFKTFTSFEGSMCVGSGEVLDITGVGSIEFSSMTPSGVNIILLRQVHYVPKIMANLISHTELDRQGLKTTSENEVKQFFLNGVEVMRSRVIGGLWIMGLSVNYPDSMEVQDHVALISSEDLNHHRLCHLSHAGMVRLATMVDGLDVPTEQTSICAACVAGKLTRKPFQRSENARASKPLWLLHIDFLIINIAGVDGETLAMVITDDNTGMRCPFPMLDRSGESVVEVFKVFRPWAERQTGSQLKAVRHDNAKELNFGVFATLMKDWGVEQENSIDYEHEQNGVAEISNRVLLDKARTILLESGLRKSFWPDALCCAAFVANRSPYADLKLVPVHAFSGVKPDFGRLHLRVFGSFCWVRPPAEKLKGHHKLDARGILCRMIGYGQNGHCYKVLEVGTNLRYMAIHVKFDELAPMTSHPSVVGNASVVDLGSDFELDPGEVVVHEDGSDVLESDEKTPSPFVPAALTRPVRTMNQIDRYGSQSAHVACFAFITVPRNYRDMRLLSQPDQQRWRKAMAREYDQLVKDHKTWDLRIKPDDAKSIPCTWVYVQKQGPNVKAEDAEKARLCARGDMQEFGVNYEETFAPVCKLDSIRTMFAMANSLGLLIHQSDVKGAFVNAGLDGQTIWMDQPPGFEKRGLKGEKLHCYLLKSLYGLKQAGRNWRSMLQEFLASVGFISLKSDMCVFKKEPAGVSSMFIVVWVDDLLTVYHPKDQSCFEEYWKSFSQRFDVKDMGLVSRYVGTDIGRDFENRILTISQESSILDVLREFDMTEAHPKPIPLVAGLVLQKPSDDDTLTSKPYRMMVGKLMYPMVWTRPDIAFAVGSLSAHNSAATDDHWNAGMDVLRYLKGSSKLALTFRGFDSFILESFGDSDWAGDLQSGKSVYGYFIFLSGCLISWKSKKSTSVATSTTIAEIECVYHQCVQLLWILHLFSELGIVTSTALIWCDCMPAVKVLNGEKHLERTKHAIVKIEFIRDLIQRDIIVCKHKVTGDQIGDIGTKSLSRTLFTTHRNSLGLESL